VNPLLANDRLPTETQRSNPMSVVFSPFLLLARSFRLQSRPVSLFSSDLRTPLYRVLQRLSRAALRRLRKTNDATFFPVHFVLHLLCFSSLKLSLAKSKKRIGHVVEHRRSHSMAEALLGLRD